MSKLIMEQWLGVTATQMEAAVPKKFGKSRQIMTKWLGVNTNQVEAAVPKILGKRCARLIEQSPIEESETEIPDKDTPSALQDNDHSDDGSEIEDLEYEGSGDGYESSLEPEACECGYVSGYEYDNEYDSDDYWSDDYYLIVKTLNNLTRSFEHSISCPAKGPFPIEKLPREIRLKIFRFAMPDDRMKPLHEKAHDWNNRYDSVYGKHACPDPEDFPTQGQRIPTSLFLVSKMISLEALTVFNNDVYFRMDISSFGIQARGYQTSHLECFDNHEKLATWRPFKCMRNYHLNIKSNRFCVGFNAKSGTEYIESYDEAAGKIKEWLRIVADELSERSIIRKLTVTAPCRCALNKGRFYKGRFGPKDDAAILDIFKPLKRIHMPNEVRISLQYDRCKRGMQESCAEPACVDLLDTIQTSIGRLEGEPLSEQEATWKAVKEELSHESKIIEEYQRECPRRDIYDPLDYNSSWERNDVFECLNGVETPFEDTFEHAVKVLRADMAKKREKRKAKLKEVREKRRDEML